MAGQFGKGLIASPEHKLGLGHPHHLMGAAELPREASISLPPPVHQGRSNSCTGNSSAVAICQAMTERANLPAGQWTELPSRLFLYFHARALFGETNYDDGAMLTDVFEAARQLGVPRESAWPFSDDISKIAAQPTWDAYRAAADQRIVSGAYRITTKGMGRTYDVRAALAAGNPVVLGTMLDMAFEDLVPGQVWPGVTGDPVGGHAILCCGYRTNEAGAVEFKLQNSWGPEWCESGACWISQDAIASKNCSDLWIVDTVAPYSA